MITHISGISNEMVGKGWMAGRGRMAIAWLCLFFNVLCCKDAIVNCHRRRSNPQTREGIAFPTLRSTTLRSWQAWQAGHVLRSQ